MNDPIYPVYAVRDLKADGFGTPMIYVNENVAKRDFDYRIHNDNSMGFSPNDYDLYHIGSFNSRTGVIEGLDMPVLIINGGQIF